MGAPSEDWVSRGEEIYSSRIERYMPFEFRTHQVSRSKSPSEVLEAESRWLEKQLTLLPTRLILLDERGKAMTSPQLATHLEKWRQGPQKRLLFLIGSAYGFDPSLLARAQDTLSLSPLTLPHQLARLMMLEQLYRACTILRGESYHHE